MLARGQYRAAPGPGASGSAGSAVVLAPVLVHDIQDGARVLS
jgi:hypothetical protein